MQHCTVTNSWSFHCLLLRYILDLFLNHRRVSRNIPVKLVLYNPARRVRSSPALCSLIFNAFLCTSWWQHLPYPWSFRADVRKRIHTDSTRGRNSKHTPRSGEKNSIRFLLMRWFTWFTHSAGIRSLNTNQEQTPNRIFFLLLLLYCVRITRHLYVCIYIYQYNRFLLSIFFEKLFYMQIRQ